MEGMKNRVSWSGNTFISFENLIIERLKSMGYKNIKHVRVDPSRQQLVYKAILPPERIERLAQAYFATEQLLEFENLSKRGSFELVVYGDRRSFLTQGNPIQYHKLTREQRQIIKDLEILLKSKMRMDYRYIRQELRK